MADDPNKPEGQEPENQPDPVEPENQPEPEDGGEKPKTFSAEYVRQLRDEAAKQRTRAKELETQVKDFENAQLSDKEKLERERDEAKSAAAAAEKLARDAQLEALVVRKASAFQSPEDALLFVKPKLDFDETTGEPTNLDEALTSILEERPYLKREEGTTPPKISASHAQAQRTSVLTKEKLSQMTPQQIADLPEKDVREALTA